MAIQASGPISIQDLVTEFGGDAPHSILEYTRGGGLVPSSITGTFEYGWTSTDRTGSAAWAPINPVRRRYIYQTVYTESELSASGVIAGANFTSLKWHVYNALSSTYSVLGMTIKLFNTTAANGNTVAAPITGTSKTIVYSDLSTTEFTLIETVGEKQINFGGGSAGGASSSFTWDGVSNICVEVCTSQNQTGSTFGARQRAVLNVTAGGRAYGDNSSGSACDRTPTLVQTYKISTSMAWSLPINQTVPAWLGFPPYPTIDLTMYYGTFKAYTQPESPPVDLSSSFYEISNRVIDSQSYMGGTGDYNGPYDVGEVVSNYVGTGNIFIGVKIGMVGSNTFYGDLPIAGVQIVSSNGSNLLASWIFNTSTGGSGSNWQTTTTQISGSSQIGFPVTPQTASGYSYTQITSTIGTGRFSFVSSTSSSYTGAADGIGNQYKLSSDGGSATIATVGNATVPQTLNTYYVYREASGTALNSAAIMRSPPFTFSGGEKIRVIHAVTCPTEPVNQLLPDDCLYIAIYD